MRGAWGGGNAIEVECRVSGGGGGGILKWSSGRVAGVGCWKSGLGGGGGGGGGVLWAPTNGLSIDQSIRVCTLTSARDLESSGFGFYLMLNPPPSGFSGDASPPPF